jgi:peptidoglycan/LPS O-acetylase OafA/YrhL
MIQAMTQGRIRKPSRSRLARVTRVTGNRPGGDSFRKDIQGLRAIAVLLVVLDHAGVRRLAGGYIGVDVFFVISGFLITGWLLRHYERGEGIPFGEFYAARARRILPAATLTLVATVLASWYFLNYVRAVTALHDVVWATFFAANIHYARAGTDYFAQFAPPSPVQQFWTLAVEEQFYLAWPALLAAAMFVVRPRFGRSRGSGQLVGSGADVLTTLLGMLVIASFVWTVHDTPVNPTGAYFSTLTRCWELGVGALLAICSGRLCRLPSAARGGTAWIGLAGVVVAAVAYTAQTPFPGYAAVLPVASAALIIIGGLGEESRWGLGPVLLSRQPLRFTGDISYSLYLWHWPILIIATQYVGHSLSVRTNLALMAGGFALSAVTYTVYENPLRRSVLLSTRQGGLCLWPVTVSVVVITACLAITQINQQIADASQLARLAFPVQSERSSKKAHNDATTHSTAMDKGSVPTTTYTAAVAASLKPSRAKLSDPYGLSPPIATLPGDSYNLSGCTAGFGDATSGPICRWGDTTSHRTLVVVGDSHAQMWMAGFINFARRYHWKLIPLIKEGCEPTDLLQHGIPVCKEWYAWVLHQLSRLRPRVIVIAQAWSDASLHGNTSTTAAYAGLAGEMVAFKRLAVDVLVNEDVPHIAKNPVDCLLANGATFGSCTFRLERAQLAIHNGVRYSAIVHRVTFLPTLQWFCLDQKCPTVVGNTIAYQDEDHMSATYGAELAAPFASEIERAIKAGQH